jgi:citrate synthase
LIKLINMKNMPEPLYLTAREAASELSVSPATLYAYVSRGLVRSEPLPESRARRYRAEDVRALRNRRAPMPAAGRGSETDMPVLDSAISTITEAGPLYRGVQAIALARDATLEQTATLLWDANGADPFAADNLPVMSDAMRVVAAAAATQPPLVRAIAVIALAGNADPKAFNRSPDGRARVAARVMRLVASSILGTEPSAQPLHRQVARAWAPGNPAAEDLLRRAMVLLADHELNASTYTLRCAASTGLNLYDQAIAGLVALKGPLHGGAGPLAARLVAELAVGDAAARIADKVALGERIPGFGHTIYKQGDPRGDDLLKALSAAGADRRLAVDVPAAITEATGLHPNIDFALAVMTHMLGLPAGAEIALFAIARTAGWTAHGMEQMHGGGLIRPRARYTGPAPSPRGE